MKNEMDPIELKLKALAFRGEASSREGGEPCPDDETFSAFMDGLLFGGQADAVKEHIIRCRVCNLAYAVWQEASKPGEPSVPSHLIESARSLYRPPMTRVVIKLFKNAFQILNAAEVAFLGPSPGAEAVPCRGSGQADADRFEIADIDPGLEVLESIRIQHLEETATVKLSVFPSPGLSPDKRKQIRVDLYAESGLIQSWPLKEAGTAMNPIERGAYRLSLVEVTPALEEHEVKVLGFVELNLS